LALFVFSDVAIANMSLGFEGNLQRIHSAARPFPPSPQMPKCFLTAPKTPANSQAWHGKSTADARPKSAAVLEL
jgi:hypothetical protein